MYEDYMRKRTNLHNGMHANTNPSPKKRKLGITGFQIIICVLCIVVSVVIRLIGGNTFATVQESVSGAINKPVTNSDVSGVFANIKSNLPDVSEIFSSSSSTKNSSSGSGASGSSSSGASGTSSQGANSSSSTGASSSSQSSSSSQASST